MVSMPRPPLIAIVRPVVLANQVHLALRDIMPSPSPIPIIVVTAVVVVAMLPVFPPVRLGAADADCSASEQHGREYRAE
jgi:hypothetical protein